MRVLINQPTMEIALTRRNLTQKEFARKLNVSSGYVSLMIKGRRCIPAVTRRRILQCLRGYTFDDLFIIETKKDGDNGSATG